MPLCLRVIYKKLVDGTLRAMFHGIELISSNISSYHRLQDFMEAGNIDDTPTEPKL